MKLIDRYKKPTPTFFRKLRNIGIALAATGGAIIAAPIALPALVITIATYLTVVGTALNIGVNDLLFTAIMSVIGAVVSFFVSSILRKLFSDSDKSKNA